ncbi:MAG: metallophosphoesterase [Oscillospiraceae bacterium]|nr:metallophosphoesterase [Oscillospiraceae bacterium]
MLSFYVITDLHYFENSLGAMGEAYEARSLTDQKCIAETGAILDAAFARLAQDNDTNIILIPGDHTFNGEPESHAAVIAKLNALKALGKQVYVVSGNHDGDHEAYAFRDAEQFTIPNVTREELKALYHDFGPAQAIAQDDSQMCYVVQLGEGLRLLGVNYTHNLAPHMPFILEQIESAKRDGQLIIGMMHVPVLPGSPILTLPKDATIQDGNRMAAQLAGAGLPLMFTGHMHMQSVSKLMTEQGNFFIDICTGSAVGGPAVVRKCSIVADRRMNITSMPSVIDFDWDKQGMTAEEYFAWRFERKIKHEMRAMPRVVQNLRLGTIARLLCIRAHPSLNKRKLIDACADIVRRVFYGDQAYTSETPEHIFLMKVLRRCGLIVRMAEKKLAPKHEIFADIPALVSTLIGKELKIDNHCVIDLNTGDIVPLESCD